MTKILVATDGSENSERALIVAKEYTECSNGKITILTVLEPLGIYTTTGYQVTPVDVLENAGEFILKNSLELFDEFKDKVNTKVRIGYPADEIIDEAQDGNYDLIIIGSRGQGTFSRTFLGSVSNKVLNHTDSDVLIVK